MCVLMHFWGVWTKNTQHSRQAPLLSELEPFRSAAICVFESRPSARDEYMGAPVAPHPSASGRKMSTCIRPFERGMKFLLARYVYTHEIFRIGSIGDMKKGTSRLNKFYALPNACDIKFSTNKIIFCSQGEKTIQKSENLIFDYLSRLFISLNRRIFHSRITKLYCYFQIFIGLKILTRI